MVALKVGVAPSHPTTTATTAATITTRSAQDTESFVLGVRGLSRYACVEARLCVQMHVICETFSSARPYRENASCSADTLIPLRPNWGNFSWQRE